MRQLRGVELDDDIAHALYALDPGAKTSQALCYGYTLTRIVDFDPQRVVTAVFRSQHEY
jgi:hypothetical protein